MAADANGPIAVELAADHEDIVAWTGPAVELAAEAQPPAALFARLIEAKLYRNAVEWLPAILPVRKAIWWSCLSAWQFGPPQLQSQADQALGAAVHWVQRPTRSHRLAASAFGAEQPWSSPAACCAAAVGWACHRDGADEPWMIGDLPLACRLCARAVLLAGGDDSATLRKLLALGVEIAQDKIDWTAVKRN